MNKCDYELALFNLWHPVPVTHNINNNELILNKNYYINRSSNKPLQVLQLGKYRFANFAASVTSYICSRTWHSYRTLFASLIDNKVKNIN